MEYLRKKYICKNQIKKGRAGVKDAINYIQNKFSVALMIDQRVSEGKKLPFFEHAASTTTLPSQLAIKYQLDIVPIYIARDANNSFKMKIYDPIKFDPDDTIEKMTYHLNSWLEKVILKNPDQWIWTHNRWK